MLWCGVVCCGMMRSGGKPSGDKRDHIPGLPGLQSHAAARPEIPPFLPAVAPPALTKSALCHKRTIFSSRECTAFIHDTQTCSSASTFRYVCLQRRLTCWSANNFSSSTLHALSTSSSASSIASNPPPPPPPPLPPPPPTPLTICARLWGLAAFSMMRR